MASNAGLSLNVEGRDGRSASVELPEFQYKPANENDRYSSNTSIFTGLPARRSERGLRFFDTNVNTCNRLLKRLI